MPTEAAEPQTARIRRLNDALRRQGGAPGKFVMTAGVASLPLADQRAVIRKVMTFDVFTPDNDPYGEHDFGSFEHKGQKLFWKIDYYALGLTHGSEDPADPGQTKRVLTIMLADEY